LLPAVSLKFALSISDIEYTTFSCHKEGKISEPHA